MKVTIFGAGFIGSALAPTLLARDHEVTAVDIGWFGNYLPAACEQRWIDAGRTMISDLQGQDCVIFLAGVSNDPMAGFDPYLNYVANAALPGFLAYQSARAGVPHFIHGGSCSVYGRAKTATEITTAATGFPYGISKYMGEVGCSQAARAANDMAVLNFRMGTVCGFSPRMRFDLLVNAMVKDAFLHHEISVNDPLAWRPVLDIRDAVSFYIDAIETPTMQGTINILSWNCNVQTVAERVQTLMSKHLGIAVKIIDKGVEDLRSYAASNVLAANCGLIPKHDLDSTIMNVIGNLDQFEDLDADEYYNIRVFEKLSKA